MPDIPASSVLYVAAPVRVGGEIAGAVTLVKPTTNINDFLKIAKMKISRAGLIAAAMAMLLSLLASFWITRPIKKLTRYADDIRLGKRVPLPRLDRTEIGDMGFAFERMTEALEGKNYVERYVQALTHEIKSPLSAIRGAAELLAEKMTSERRARFLANIRNEADRVQVIVDRMLKLTELETLKILPKVERVSLPAVVKTVCESLQPWAIKKQLIIQNRVPGDIIVRGDTFLLHQAVENLLQNAVDFSPVRSRIDLTAVVDEKSLHFRVADNGPGIPDYARERVFEKFFSLQRPDSGKKSTGLGLNFVREVAHLHGGGVALENRPGKGVRATLTLPL
jgi:two-component system sensor histidine kinase CreC